MHRNSYEIKHLFANLQLLWVLTVAMLSSLSSMLTTMTLAMLSSMVEA